MRFILKALYVCDRYRAGVLAGKHLRWLGILLCNGSQFLIAFNFLHLGWKGLSFQTGLFIFFLYLHKWLAEAVDVLYKP